MGTGGGSEVMGAEEAMSDLGVFRVAAEARWHSRTEMWS